MSLDSRALKKLGINTDLSKMYPTVTELVKSDVAYVAAKTINDCVMNIDDQKIGVHRGDVVMMPLNMYLDCKRSGDKVRQLKPNKKSFNDMFRRYRGQNLDNKKLLIMRVGGIGDLMFAQPIIKHIRKMFTNTKIVFACAPRYMSLFKSWPEGLVDLVIPIPYGKKVLQSTDYHLTFEGSIERTIESRNVNAYDIFAKVCKFNIDFNDPYYKLELKTDDEIQKKLEDKLPNNFIIPQFRATSPLRMMSTEKWIYILKRLETETDLNFVLIDQIKHKNVYDRFIDEGGFDKSRFFNLCSVSSSITTACNIIAKSNGVLGIDSSFNHIASGYDKPILGLFGPFRGDLRLKYYKTADWIDSKDTSCDIFPCYGHHNEMFKCDFVTNAQPPACMNAIDNDLVVEKAKKQFGGV